MRERGEKGKERFKSKVEVEKRENERREGEVVEGEMEDAIRQQFPRRELCRYAIREGAGLRVARK